MKRVNEPRFRPLARGILDDSCSTRQPPDDERETGAQQSHPNKPMKTNRFFLLLTAILGMTAPSPCWAGGNPQPYVIDTFDNSNSLSSWYFLYAGVPASLTFDPSVNAGGGASGSGSLKVSMDFTPRAENTPEVFIERMFSGIPWVPSVTVSAGSYTNMTMDILWGADSTVDADGTYGTMFTGLLGVGHSYLGDLTTTVSTSAGNLQWVHAVIPAQDQPGTDLIGFYLHYYEGALSGANSIHGPVTFWIDNVELVNVPEPAAVGLLGIAAIVIRVRRLSSAARLVRQRS